MSFHFSNEAVPVRFVDDFKKLNHLNDEQFAGLFQIVLEFLTKHDGDSFAAGVEEFSQTHNVKIAVLKELLQSLIHFLKLVLRRNMNVTMFKEDLERLGLSAGKVEQAGSYFGENYVAMSRAQMDQTVSVNELVDLEWNFGVTAASSEEEQVGSSYLQLKLRLETGSGPEAVHVEMSLPQFYKFLHEMEAAKSAIDLLSS